MPFAVCLAKPWKSDVAVKFAYTIEGDMPEEIVTFREGGAVVIPAGELAARDTMDLRTDWSFVPQEAATYKVTVGIGSVQPVSGQLRISSKQKELSVQINKAKSMGYTGRRETFGQPDCGLQRLGGLCYQCG